MAALKEGKVRGAALDVLEYEKARFEDLFENQKNEDFDYLLKASNVLLSPHVAGWSTESHRKLAEIVMRQIILNFGKAWLETTTCKVSFVRCSMNFTIRTNFFFRFLVKMTYCVKLTPSVTVTLNFDRSSVSNSSKRLYLLLTTTEKLIAEF